MFGIPQLGLHSAKLAGPGRQRVPPLGSSAQAMLRRRLLDTVLGSLRAGARGFSSGKKGACSRGTGRLGDMRVAWTHTAHCPMHSAGPKGLRLGSVAAGHHHQRHAPGGKQGGQAAQQQQPAATKPHIANRIIEDTPPIYIPTVEEAAAIERRNYLTFGANVRCACGLASAAALSGAPGARLSGRIHVCLGETRVAVQPASCRAASGTSLPDLAPAGTLLAAVGAAYYTFWQRNKPEVGGAAAAGLVWQAAPGCNSCHGPFLTRTWQRGSCLGGSTGSRRSRPGRPPESQVLSPVPARPRCR